MKEESAVKDVKFCSCGSIRFLFDMERLCHQSSHRETLLEIADMLDEACASYLQQSEKMEEKKVNLKVIQ